MLVVDRHTLVAVDLLHLVYEVLLGLANALDLQEFLGISSTLYQSITGVDLHTVDHFEPCARRDRVGIFLAIVGDNDDLAASAVVVANSHNTGGAGQRGLALRRAGFEQLDNARQTTSDVLCTCNTTGVEGTHR